MLTFDKAVAALRGGRFESGRYRTACPAHGGRNRNLSVWADEHANACFKCWSHDCSTRDIVAALGSASPEHRQQPASTRPKPTDERSNRDRALGIWREAREPRGTIVQDYLFGRGFTGEMPWKLDNTVDYQLRRELRAAISIPASIRFHPRLKHRSGVHLPAMITAIEDLDGRIVGIHRTFLKPDGSDKADVAPNKMALGRLKGCAVHLAAGGAEIVVCEGIETGLAILQAIGLNVWAALGTSNLGQVEMPAFVREIIVAADHDDPGLKAARKAADLYKARGVQVRIVIPAASGADFNDLRGGG
jgi:Toprim domain-containing protein